MFIGKSRYFPLWSKTHMQLKNQMLFCLNDVSILDTQCIYKQTNKPWLITILSVTNQIVLNKRTCDPCPKLWLLKHLHGQVNKFGHLSIYPPLWPTTGKLQQPTPPLFLHYHTPLGSQAIKQEPWWCNS